MPSRKRNKGQARKASKGAAGAGVGARKELFGSRQLTWTDRCNHGMTATAGSASAMFVTCFLDECLKRWEECHKKGTPTTGLLEDCIAALPTAYAKHHDALDDAEKRKHTICHLVSNGADCILQDPNYFLDSRASKAFNGLDIQQSRSEFYSTVFAMAALILEHFEASGDFMNAAISAFSTGKDALANIDLCQGCERSLIKFYAKRISCSCLEKHITVVKSQPKMGLCHNRHCAKRSEVGNFMVCSRCKSVQYCSRSCQHSNWPEHKQVCGK